MTNPRSKWTIQNVSEYVGKIEADIFVSLDYPPHVADSKMKRRAKIEASTKNFEFLDSAFPSKTIMPVVHGRTIAEVEFSVELLAQLGGSLTWIGLGGIVPLLQHRFVTKDILKIGPEIFISRALKIIRNAFPSAKIHAFGAGGTRTFPAVFALGADSADSIGWRQAAGFGSIFLPLKSQRVVCWNLAQGPPRKLLDDSDLEQLAGCECPICRSHSSIDSKLNAFRASFHGRSIHNAWTITKQIRYWPKSRAEMKSIVASGALGGRWAKAVNEISGRQSTT
jgi:queuine/archaeosine tRNA-ribosyltransferase